MYIEYIIPINNKLKVYYVFFKVLKILLYQYSLILSLESFKKESNTYLKINIFVNSLL